MRPAQRNLELVLNLRAEGARPRSPTRSPPRSAAGRPPSSAIDAASPARCRPSSPPTSSTPSASRRSSRTRSTTTTSAARRSPRSRFLPNIVAGWTPATVGDRLGAAARQRLAGDAGEAAPGLHGHGLTQHRASATSRCSPTPARSTASRRSANLTFTVKFANQGENDESNVTVTVEITGAGKTITRARRRSTRPTAEQRGDGERSRSAQAPPVGTPVDDHGHRRHGPRREERPTTTRSTYTVMFTR